METIINDLVVHTNGSKKNKAMVFVHGFPYDNTMWKEQINFFKDDFLCVSYDVRGLGKSKAGDGQFTIEQFVDDLTSIINNLKIDKPILCGLSMGGYISLRAVERMQNKFSALILCDTKSGADTNEAKINRAKAIKKINNSGFNNFIEEFLTNCFAENFINKNSAEFGKIISHSQNNDPVGVKGCLLAMAARTDTTGFLQKINISTLLICGSEDKLTPPKVMKAMANQIKGADFVVIEGAGHMTPVEKPDIVNQTIKKFLTDKNL